VGNYRFTLEYDGTDFEGWQMQPEGIRTVQGCLTEALSRVAGRPVSCMGSGRTDAGVHAEGQVANARFETRLAPNELLRALNDNLPGDVAILDVCIVADAFHARRDALSKHYRYRIWNHPVRSPLRARRCWWVRGALDVKAIGSALPELLGERDFASFQGGGSSVTTSVRRLFRAEVSGRPGGEVHLDFEADGFLRHMVRNLAGTLVEVGLGRRPPDLAPVLAARDRAAAGVTAPPQGLALVAVEYP